MQRRPLLLFTFLIVMLTGAYSQGTLDFNLYRTYDGSQNNLDNPDWGKAGTNLLRLTGVAYADSISAPTGANRPNPRVISNTLFAQNGPLADPLNLSDFCWVWGQFIDHDIGITPDGFEPAMIPVPSGDPSFDPLGMGTAIIPMMRNTFDPTTGTNSGNPRQHPNMITSYIDGSGVYGSDQERADWLRTFSGGKLKVSAGNLLPFNTLNGEVDGEIDPDAPHMDDAVGLSDRLFVAGDVRANENVLLTAFHTIFVREHNRICDELAHGHPDWDDEQLYQHARKLVGGLIQTITFEEWLPAMGVNLPDYAGYDNSLNAQLSNMFTAAAFRLGHTLLSSTLVMMDNEGDPMHGGSIGLRDVFFNPMALIDHGGVDPFIKGMATQTQQKLDAKVVDDIRNFLFGPPEAGIGGLDLASININRGRERGIRDYNSIRQSMGLPAYQYFQQVNSDAAVFSSLISLYADINNVDAWVGLLAESPMPGSLFGQTILTILETQFGTLRNGDRFYFENDPVLTNEEKNWIKTKTLHDVIMKNTGINLMQDNVFEAMSHDEICDNMTSEVQGRFYTENGVAVPDVTVDLVVDGSALSLLSNSDGVAYFGEVAACLAESMVASRDDEVDNGVSTFDLIRIQRHILGVDPLDSPYKLIAADVDNNGSITVADLIEIRRVVLAVSSAFPNNTSWRFVPADYTFIDPENPLDEDFPEANESFDILSSDFERDYIAIKVGDVSGDVELNLGDDDLIEDRDLVAGLALQIEDMVLQAGETYQVPVVAAADQTIEGLQFAFNYNPAVIQLKSIEAGALTNWRDEHYASFEDMGIVRTSWNGGTALSEGDALFYLEIEAKETQSIQEVLTLDFEEMDAVAFDQSLLTRPIALHFLAGNENAEIFRLSQNQPNPFGGSTLIPFYMNEEGWAKLAIYDPSGKEVFTYSANFNKGQQEWHLQASHLPGTGIYYYRVETATATATKRMLVQ